MTIVIPSLVSLRLPFFSYSLNLTRQLEGHSFKIQARPYYSSAQDPPTAPHLIQNRISSPENGLGGPVRAATPHCHPSDFIPGDSHTSPLQEHCFLLFCRHTRDTPTPGPLSLLFPLPKMLLPDGHMDYSLTPFRSWFKCYSLIKVFPGLSKTKPSPVPSFTLTG